MEICRKNQTVVVYENALDDANKKMLSASEGMSAFSNVGLGYIDIAFDEPNLFLYLYMSGESGYHAGGFDISLLLPEYRLAFGISVYPPKMDTVTMIVERFRIPL